MSLVLIASLLTLTALEIVLGIDNLIFLSLLTNKLPEQQRLYARRIGLLFAMVSRLLLLFLMNRISQFEKILFNIDDIEFTTHSIIIGLGGLFLFYKALKEIHNDLEDHGPKNKRKDKFKIKMAPTFWSIMIQVMILDVVFSLDSVITAVGMSNDYLIMATAIIISVIVMLIASAPLGRFIENHPTIKMLALSFLLLVGTMLIAESIGYHIEKGYLYFAIAFSLLVESLNIFSAIKKKNHNL